MKAQVITDAALWFLGLSLVVGQLLRLPLWGQSGGLLVSDIAVVLVLGIAFLQYCRHLLTIPPAGGTPPMAVANYSLLTTPFIIWSLLTLAVNASSLAPIELTIAFSYWLRTSAYLALLPALLYLTRDPRYYRTLARSFIGAGGILVIIGLLQVFFLPNVAAFPALLLTITGGGWDPHEGRLLSTWLDPNFFGAFAVIFLFYISPKKTIGHAFFSVLTAAALILTQSRSNFVSLTLTLLALSPLIVLGLVRQRRRSRLALSASLLSIVVLTLSIAALSLGERLSGLFRYDPTVQARGEALAAAWRLAQETPLLGVGYNAWQFTDLRAGLVSDLTLHSRAGTDNSWLTLLVTTGLPGLFLFAAPWLALATATARRWLLLLDPASLAALLSIFFLALHAQFVNSFLYAHLLLTLACVCALSAPPANPDFDELSRVAGKPTKAS